MQTYGTPNDPVEISAEGTIPTTNISHEFKWLRREAMVTWKRDLWNRCQECGRLISYNDINIGKAIHRMVTPDTNVSYETWETLCHQHSQR